MTLYAVGRLESDNVASQAKADAWASMLASFMTNIRNNVATGVTMTLESPMIARDHRDGAGIGEFTVVQSPTTGNSVGDFLPLAASLVIGWRTDLPTRRGRGRTFTPPSTETLNEANGTPTSGAIVTAQSAAAALIAASSASTEVAFSIWSRPAPEADPPRIGTVRSVLTSRVRDTWGSLRSRRD
jgi:hypothetical protein